MLFYLYSHEQNCDTQTGFYGHASSPVLWRNFVSLFFFFMYANYCEIFAERAKSC